MAKAKKSSKGITKTSKKALKKIAKKITKQEIRSANKAATETVIMYLAKLKLPAVEASIQKAVAMEVRGNVDKKVLKRVRTASKALLKLAALTIPKESKKASK